MYRWDIDIQNMKCKYEKYKEHFLDLDISNLEGKENIVDILQHKDVEEDNFHNLDEVKLNILLYNQHMDQEHQHKSYEDTYNNHLQLFYILFHVDRNT